MALILDPFSHHEKDEIVMRKPKAKRAKKVSSPEFIDTRDEDETVSMNNVQEHAINPVVTTNEDAIDENDQVAASFSEF